MSDDFDSLGMPPLSAGFPARGRWLIDNLSVDLDLTEDQAAGIVGNLGYESEGLATLQERQPVVPGSRGGYGWAQWTGPRRRDFEAWAAAHHLDPSSDEANYGFLLHELRGNHAYVVERLREEPTLEDSVFLVGRLYEAPGGTTATFLPGFEDRLSYAQQALAGAQDAGGAPLPATPLPEPPSARPAPPQGLSDAVPPLGAYQEALNAAGALPQITVNGVWSDETARAAERYYAPLPSLTLLQIKLNNAGATPRLVVDGVWGPRTAAAVATYYRRDQG